MVEILTLTDPLAGFTGMWLKGMRSREEGRVVYKRGEGERGKIREGAREVLFHHFRNIVMHMFLTVITALNILVAMMMSRKNRRERKKGKGK